MDSSEALGVYLTIGLVVSLVGLVVNLVLSVQALISLIAIGRAIAVAVTFELLTVGLPVTFGLTVGA